MKAVFAGGGTLGSVTPLLAAARAWRELAPGHEAHWIGTTFGPEGRLVVEAGAIFHAVSSGRLRRYFDWRNFTDLFRIAAGFFQSLSLLGLIRPAVVVSAGGFVAVPVVWAAWCRRIPVHIHQMDIRPGLANKLAAPFASSASVAFEKSVRDFPKLKPIWTGNPIRSELFAGSRAEARRRFGLNDRLPTVLVLGGGTGATNLNRLVVGALPSLAGQAQVLHLTGQGKAMSVDRPPATYHQVEFLTHEMRHAYAAADLVVSRAGMGALTEIAALGLPAVIVPMSASHQEENAAFFARETGAPVMDERQIQPAGFAAQLLLLLRDRGRLAALGHRLGQLNRPDAAERLAELIQVAAIVGQRGRP